MKSNHLNLFDKGPAFVRSFQLCGCGPCMARRTLWHYVVLNVEEASQASKLEIAIQIDPHVHACT
jgi:hypothetical protein